MCITSLIGLFDEMVKMVSAKYLMTSHVNQDFVENSFGIIRGMGGFNLKPTQVDVIHRIKKLIVGRRFNQSMGTNSNTTEDQNFLSSNSLLALMTVEEEEKFPFRSPVVQNNMIEDILDIESHVESKDINLKDLGLYDKCEEGGKEFVAGFITKTLGNKCPELVKNPSEFTQENGMWIRMLSDGGLTEPSTYWLSHFRKFEEYFEVFNPNGKLNQDYDIVKRLTSFLIGSYPAVSEKAIKLYAKTRTMIRIAAMNRQAESKKFLFQEQRRNMNRGILLEDPNENTEDCEEVEDMQAEENVEEMLNIIYSEK